MDIAEMRTEEALRASEVEKKCHSCGATNIDLNIHNHWMVGVYVECMDRSGCERRQGLRK